MKRISVLTVNYNGRGFIGDFLVSLSQQTVQPDEIVIVDNASTDDSLSYLRQRFPYVKLVASGTNTGFAQGNNEALAHAQGDYLALFNPDTLLDPDCLAELVRVLESDQRIAVTTARILNLNRITPRESVGMGFNNLGYPFVRYLNDSSGEAFNRPTAVPMMSGCAFVIRRTALAGEPLFDPDIFMYGDELELSLRLLGRGQRIVAVPTARVEHRGSLSVQSLTRRPRVFHHFLFQRNRVKILAKYYPGRLLVQGLPLILGGLLYWDLLFLWYGGPRLLIRAIASQIAYARRGLAERRSHRIDPEAWLPWMSGHGIGDMLQLRSASSRAR